MRIMRLVRLVSVALLATALLLGITGAPSTASTKTTLSLTTAKTSSGDGQAKLNYSLGWRTRTSVEVLGMLDDICPGDGYSPRAVITVTDSKGRKQTRTFTNTATCAKGATSFGWGAVAKSRITTVVVRVCEVNYSTTPDRVRDCVSRSSKNPR